MHSTLIHDIAGAILVLSAVFLTMGMIRPMIVLWWTQDKTRTKVLAIYGSVALVAGIVFFVTISPAEDPIKDETHQGNEYRTKTRT